MGNTTAGARVLGSSPVSTKGTQPGVGVGGLWVRPHRAARRRIGGVGPAGAEKQQTMENSGVR